MWIQTQEGKEGPIFIFTYPEDCGGHALFVEAARDARPESYIIQIKKAEHSCLDADSYLDFSTLRRANMRSLAAALTDPRTKNYGRYESASDMLVQKIQKAALGYPLLEPVQKNLIEQAMQRRS